MIIIMILLMHLLSHNSPDDYAINSVPETETLSETPPETSNWDLCKKKENVSIFQRWVEAEPGRDAREIYVETVVSAKPEKLTQIILDENYGKQWLAMADEYKVITRPSPDEWYAYSRFNFTPLLKFDLITFNQLSADQENHSYTIGISGKPDYWPEKKNFRRLSHFSGKWEFIPADDGQTCVRYYLFSKTKPFLPRWITDPFVFNELESCINNVKLIAEKS